MNKYHRKGFSWHFGAIVLSFGLMVVLAACGQSATSTGTGGSSPAPTTSPATPTSIKGYGTANGCPSDTVVASVPAKANVTVQGNTVKDSVAAHTGDIIEIRLPFGQKWVGPTASIGVLQLQDPSGYAMKSDHVCVWRFQAKGSGSTPLTFTGRAICVAGKMCPLYVESVSFSVDVK